MLFDTRLVCLQAGVRQDQPCQASVGGFQPQVRGILGGVFRHHHRLQPLRRFRRGAGRLSLCLCLQDWTPLAMNHPRSPNTRHKPSSTPRSPDSLLAFAVASACLPDCSPQVSYFVILFGLCLPIMVFPLVQVDPSEALLAVGQRYGVRANVWIVIYSFIGNYW